MCAFVAPKADAASAGSLIKMNGLSSVYFLASDGKRYVFPNETTYFSWYSDFSSVTVVPQAELEAAPLGANVTVRPGTKLVKITTNPKVYAVTAGGSLLAVPDEATALALYGANWNKKIVDVPDAFFTNYKIAAGTVSATAYPAGSLVKFGTGADVYYIGADGKAQKIASEAAFNANRFNWNNVITSTLVLPAVGAEIAGAVATLTDTSSGAGGVAYVGGTGLTVALSGDTLGSTNLPSLATLIPFVTVNLTAANDGAVTISDVTFTRSGTGATSDFEGGYLYSGDTRLTNIRNVDSSNNTIQFSAVNLVIPAGQTKQLTLRMNALTTGTVGGSHSFKLASASAISATGATVSGSFPVSGNMMSFSTSASAASLTLTSSGSAGNKKVGESQVTVGEFTINNSTASEDVNIYRFRLKQEGTANVTAAKNFSLDLDGTKVAENVQMSSDKYVDFVLTTPFLLKKSKQITATVRGDISGDIGKNLQLIINNKVDVDARGSAYGNFYSAATNAVAAGAIITIQGSNINVSLDGPVAQEVKKNITNVVFAKLLIKTDNEDVNLEKLGASITMLNIVGSTGGTTASTSAALNNVKLVDSGNNSSYTVTDPTGLTTVEDVTFENVYLKKGTQYAFEFRGDIADGVVNGAKYTVGFKLNVGTDTTKGRYTSSDTAIVAGDFSSTALTGQPMTVALPNVIFGKVATNNNTVVKSATKVLLYKGKITAGSVDNLKVSKIPFKVTLSGPATVGASFDRLYLYAVASDGAETFLDDENSLSMASDGFVVFSGFTLAIPKGIPGTQYYVVRGDVKSVPTPGTIILNVKNSTATSSDFTVRDSENNALVDAQYAVDFAVGQTTTIASKGAMTLDFDTNEVGTNAVKNVLAGSTFLAGRIKLTAQNENAKIIDLVLGTTLPNSDSDIGSLILYKDKEMTQMVGATALTSAGTAKFEGLNFEVPTVGTTYLYLAVQSKAVDYSVSPASASTGHTAIAVTFNAGSIANGTKIRGVSTGDDFTTAEATIGSTASKTATMYGAIISGVTTSFTNATLGDGPMKIFSFKVTVPTPSNNVAYDGAALGVNMATTTFTISSTTGVTLSSWQVQRVGGANGKKDATEGVSLTHNVTGGTAVIGFGNVSGLGNDIIVRPGETAEYEIYATVNGGSGSAKSLLVYISSLANMLYNHNTQVGTAAATYTSALYPIISGISDVTGGRLSN